MCAAAVCLRDRVHDRESESGTGALASAVAAAEAFEEPRGEARTLVCDVQLDAADGVGEGEAEFTPSVAQTVVDQVGKRLLEAKTIAV
jgi:hypothetical protein